MQSTFPFGTVLSEAQRRRFFRLNLFAAILACALLLAPTSVWAASADPATCVVFSASSGSFTLAKDGKVAPLFVDAQDFAGVARAAADLQADVERVTKVKPEMLKGDALSGKNVVIIGTLGKSKVVDALAKSGKIDTKAVTGKWESFVIATVDKPMAGVDQALVIAGSDKRGTIYGVYEISEQIGVSPWYWWADVPSKPHDALYVKAGAYVQGPPSVKYRGIFLNDEAPCLSGWTKEKFGGMNSKFYTKLFELILRLRGNYLWPAMWGNAFNEMILKIRVLRMSTVW